MLQIQNLQKDATKHEGDAWEKNLLLEKGTAEMK